jgi:hypothetical protein
VVLRGWTAASEGHGALSFFEKVTQKLHKAPKQEKGARGTPLKYGRFY